MKHGIFNIKKRANLFHSKASVPPKNQIYDIKHGIFDITKKNKSYDLRKKGLASMMKKLASMTLKNDA